MKTMRGRIIIGTMAIAAAVGGIYGMKAGSVGQAPEGAVREPFREAAEERLHDNELVRYRTSYMNELLAKVLNVDAYRSSLLDDGSWKDIPYGDKDRFTEQRKLTHLYRTADMAKSYANPKSKLYRNQELLAQIDKALAYWVQGKFRFANWYYNQITVPQNVMDIALLVGRELPERTTAPAVQTVKDELANVRSFERDVGANLVMKQENKIRLALFTGNEPLLREGFARIGQEVMPVMEMGESAEWRDALWRSYVKLDFRRPTIEGIQADYSFLEHGPMLYSGGYGKSFLNDVIRLAYLSRDTDLFPERALRNVTDYFLEHVQWVVKGNTFDYNTIGRQIAVDGSDTSGNARVVMTSLERLLALPGVTRKSELEAFAKRMKGEGTPLMGNRYYWRADYMVQQGGAYAASVKMSSNRTIATEAVNMENVQGHHLADGATFIYRTGTEYDRIFTAWDWTKVPGTTALEAPFPDVSEQHVAIPGSASEYAGGVTDMRNGAAAMQLVRGDLTAKKAWFFTDTAMVALGTDITALSAQRAVTSVNQSLLRGEVTVSDGRRPFVKTDQKQLPESYRVSWVHHDQTGYVFPEQPHVQLTNGAQSGNRYFINRNGRKVLNPQETADQQVFSLWLDHGAAAAGKSYAYMVVPDTTAEALEQFANRSPLRILSNTGRLQAVWDERAAMLQAAGWEPGDVSAPDGLTIGFDRPVLLLLREENDAIAVSVSDPASASPEVRLTFNRRFDAPGALWDDVRGTTTYRLRLPGGDYAGQSVTFRLKKADSQS